MRIILVTLGIVSLAAYALKALTAKRDAWWDSIRSHERRERCQGWTDGTYWPLTSEVKALEARRRERA